MKKKLQHYGVIRKIVVFPNGLADRSYPKNPPEKTLEDGHELRMIWHSRVSAEKRIMVLLKALRMVTGKYRLDVYGGGTDLKKAKRYVKRHHLNVYLHGNTPFDKVQEAVKKAHLDTLVSYNFDNHPLTLVEAEANGIPVLICDQDMAGLVPKDSFVLAKNETAEAIAEALDNLMADPDKIRRMSRVMISHREETKVSNRIGDLVKFFNEIKK
jgi:glycosyltransferase involved in cell wall biosynthesis